MARSILLALGVLALLAGCRSSDPATGEGDPYEAQPVLADAGPAPSSDLEPIPAPRPVEEPAETVVVVQKGDTLWNLAVRYYGNGQAWRRIWEANKVVIPDPADMRVGLRLVIPHEG